MGGACGDRVKTIKTIFVAEKVKFLVKKLFNVNDSELRGYLTRATRWLYQFKSHVEGELFPLIADSGLSVFRRWASKNTSINYILYCQLDRRSDTRRLKFPIQIIGQ